MKVNLFTTFFVIDLILGTAYQALSESVGNDLETEYNDEYYEYDDDNVDDYSVEVASGDGLFDSPYFEQTDAILYANEGGEAIIDCKVRNFHKSNVLVWYKDKTVIASGFFAVNNRFEIYSNNTIRIKNVQSADQGDYYCEVMPAKIVMHTHLIVSNNDLSIVCDGRDVSERVVTFRQGEMHICECKTNISDVQKIKWFINGKRAESSFIRVVDGAIIIDNVIPDHNGVYQCLGDDGSQGPLHSAVTINVFYKPKVSTKRQFVNVEYNKSAELYCDYNANPLAHVNWTRNENVLSNNEKYIIEDVTLESQNRSVLVIQNVDKDDLGEYECEIENDIGYNYVKLHLILEPESPQFENMEIAGDNVTLHWLIKSAQPLSEVVLNYKMIGAYTWTTETFIHTQRHEGLDGIWKVSHEMQLTPGNWQARIKAKNNVGWSEFSVQHNFKIKAKDNDDTEVPPDEMVMMAGFGKKGATNRSSRLTPAFLTMLTIAFLTSSIVAY